MKPSPPSLPPFSWFAAHLAIDPVDRPRHFLLDPPLTGPGDARYIRVAQVVDPVRKEHLAGEAGQRQKRHLGAGQQFGVDRFAIARVLYDIGLAHIGLPLSQGAVSPAEPRRSRGSSRLAR